MDMQESRYGNNIDPASAEAAVRQMAAVGILGNIFLAVFKLLAGILGRSTAMLSDAVHTLSDVFATLIAFIGVRLSKKQADREHPYGHERMECVAAIVLAAGIIVLWIGFRLDAMMWTVYGKAVGWLAGETLGRKVTADA